MHIKMIYDRLQRLNIDAAIFHHPAELVAILNYLPHWNGSILVVKTSEEWRLFVPDNEPMIVCIPSNRIEIYPWASAKTDPWQGVIARLVSYIGLNKKFTLNNSLAMSSPSSNSGDGTLLSFEFFRNLANSGIEFIDSQSTLSEIFLYKDPCQILALKHAHVVIQKAIKSFFQDGTGKYDSEIAANVEYEITRLVGQEGIKYAKGFASVQSGSETLNAGTFNRTSGRKIEKGDWVFLELGACIDGYWVDLTRTTVAGEPTCKQIEYFNIVKKAVNESVNAVKSGISCEEIYSKAQNVFVEAELNELFTHSLGHGTGFLYHEPFPSIMKGNKFLLPTGSVITIEPGLYGQEIGGGIRIEENILVTETGYEYLSLPQKSIKG
ncbi:Xaa-Pro peptidase family protein [Providencia vermicola]|uniref:Xaa-Pro peptidase family protein n=1 Tax=Providencia vermicola TaxID=333965 RepID=UPI0032DB448F